MITVGLNFNIGYNILLEKSSSWWQNIWKKIISGISIKMKQQKN